MGLLKSMRLSENEKVRWDDALGCLIFFFFLVASVLARGSLPNNSFCAFCERNWRSSDLASKKASTIGEDVNLVTGSSAGHMTKVISPIISPTVLISGERAELCHIMSVQMLRRMSMKGYRGRNRYTQDPALCVACPSPLICLKVCASQPSPNLERFRLIPPTGSWK